MPVMPVMPVVPVVQVMPVVHNKLAKPAKLFIDLGPRIFQRNGAVEN
jgi:hypothetical protein